MKSRFQMCLKTRLVTKWDALVLVTLRQFNVGFFSTFFWSSNFNHISLDFITKVTGLEMSRDWTCPDLSQGRICLRAGLVLTCFRAGHVSGPEMSQGRTCLKFRGQRCPGLEVSRGRKCPKFQGRKCLAAGSVPKFRARSVSRPDLVCGRKSLGAIAQMAPHS